jgi:hypothetical protein
MRRSCILASLVIALTAVGVRGIEGQSQEFRLKERMSAAEFERCGLHKLTPMELSALETWVTRQVSGVPARSLSTPQQSLGVTAAEPRAATEMVAFNTSSRKYHCLTCSSALRCTKNCITIPLSEARQRGSPCGTCGGSCR